MPDHRVATVWIRDSGDPEHNWRLLAAELEAAAGRHKTTIFCEGAYRPPGLPTRMQSGVTIIGGPPWLDDEKPPETA